MRTRSARTRLPFVIATALFALSMGTAALAVDDGPRAYWKGQDETQVVLFQNIRWDIDSSGSNQFDPGQFIYPESDVEANIFLATYARHLTMFGRTAALAVSIVGGDIDAAVDTKVLPPEFLPPGVAPGTSFSQSATGFGDPSVQLVVNLFGAPAIRSGYDTANYEPSFTLDVAALLAVPIGEYDDDKLINMGLNRWYGRIAFPMTFYFGAFSPGHRTSLEFTPSVWLFDENDEFLGRTLNNDPIWQLEAHLTHDFTPSFFGSVDVLYRDGFQTEIDDVDVGEDLDVGHVGFTLSYQVTDSFAIRTGYSSNVFGDSDLDSGILRIQFAYGWHPTAESAKKLSHGH